MITDGTMVLDSQGLSSLVNRDRGVTTLLHTAQRRNRLVATSAATLVEVVHPRINRRALQWTLSRLVVVPVTRQLARTAADLLGEAGRHGHRYALDAMVAATALAAAPPTTVLTSDPDDMAALCGDAIGIVTV